jgi:hypothetical protein
VCDEKVVQIVTDYLNGMEKQAELEVRIAKFYNCDYGEFFEILNSYEVEKEEVEAMKNVWNLIK